jgi:hypothetical protein
LVQTAEVNNQHLGHPHNAPTLAAMIATWARSCELPIFAKEKPRQAKHFYLKSV